jgi:hypothetical protein
MVCAHHAGSGLVESALARGDLSAEPVKVAAMNDTRSRVHGSRLVLEMLVVRRMRDIIGEEGPSYVAVLEKASLSP